MFYCRALNLTASFVSFNHSSYNYVISVQNSVCERLSGRGYDPKNNQTQVIDTTYLLSSNCRIIEVLPLTPYRQPFPQIAAEPPNSPLLPKSAATRPVGGPSSRSPLPSPPMETVDRAVDERRYRRCRRASAATPRNGISSGRTLASSVCTCPSPGEDAPPIETGGRGFAGIRAQTSTGYLGNWYCSRTECH